MTVERETSGGTAAVLGPIDLLAIEFPGNQFTGEGLNELHRLVTNGIVRIIDLVVVTKNKDGEVSALELNDLGSNASAGLNALQATVSQMLTHDDIEAVGERLANNSTAAVMLYENAWAAKLKKAIIAANGKLVVQARVPHEIVQETLDDLAAMGAPLP